jgi:hypothetical protein
VTVSTAKTRLVDDLTSPTDVGLRPKWSNRPPGSAQRPLCSLYWVMYSCTVFNTEKMDDEELMHFNASLEENDPELFASLQVPRQEDEIRPVPTGLGQDDDAEADDDFDFSENTRTDRMLAALVDACRIHHNFDLHRQDADPESYPIPIRLRMQEVAIDADNILESSYELLDTLFLKFGTLRMALKVNLRRSTQDEVMGGIFVGDDGGGPFQNWLLSLAQVLFSPNAGLFLPAIGGESGDPSFLRISPIPGAGCVDAAVSRLLCRERKESALYRLVGRVMGLALRPHQCSPGVHAPFILGPSARLVPPVWQHILQYKVYAPQLHELRCSAARDVAWPPESARALFEAT